MMRWLFTLALFASQLPGIAQERKDLSVSNIPSLLRVGMDAVVRTDNVVYDYSSPNKIEVTTEFAVTIFNSKGAKRFGDWVEYYSSDSKVNKLTGLLYGANGVLLRKAKKGDIEDYSAVSEVSIYDDNRVKRIAFDINKFPVTVVFNSQKTEEKSYLFPTWTPLFSGSVAVESSSFTIKHPSISNINVREDLKDIEVDRVANEELLKWSLSNEKPYSIESFGPTKYEQMPKVEVNFGDIEYGNFKGNVDTWQSYGDFYHQLNTNRNNVPEQVVQEVNTLIQNASSDLEKAELIYDYVQENTRYVSVQLGVGGIQCFDADYVASNGYGDCKALSNYTKSLLDLAEIESNFVVIRSGSDPIPLSSSLASHKFNHVIIGIPNLSDTTYLECTSQTLPFGYIGDSNMGREALWISGNGQSKIVNTPAISSDDHLLTTEATITINEKGSAKINVVEERTGFQQDTYRALYNYANQDQKTRFFENNIPLSNSFSLKSFDIIVDENQPKATVTYEIEANNVAKVSSSRLFLSQAMIDAVVSAPKSQDDRKLPLVLDNSYRDRSVVNYNIPEGYAVETIPKEVDVDSDFGRFKSVFTYEGNMLKHERIFEKKSGTFPAEKFNDYVAFMTKVMKADKAKAVFKKQ